MIAPVRWLPPRWRPKLLDCLPGYSRRGFLSDLVAGMTVGLVALPLAMAFGIASGVTPQAGIYTAIVGGFLVSALGGSRLQIGGPTGAFVVIVAGIVAEHGQSGLLIVTMMAGGLLVVGAATGLAQAVRFIPRPVVIGFTNGIALLIASTQIKDFLGIEMTAVPGEFAARMAATAEAIGTMNSVALLVGLGSLAAVLVVPRVMPRVPGAVVALVGAALLVSVGTLPVETIGTRFGGIPSTLPEIAVPEFRPELIIPLLPSALTVALLAAVESLLSAVVADGMSGDRHNADAELMAQGIANLAVPVVGGIPVTGAIARTATNFRSGARTPVAGMIHALTLLAIVLVAAPLAAYVPLATLAAVLFVVAWNMGEWRQIGDVLRLDAAEILVWALTFVLTVVADLTVAVGVGVSLAALLYIRRVTDTTTVEWVTPDYVHEGRAHSLQGKDVPPYVTILRIHGPFLFGTTSKLMDEAADLAKAGSVVVLRLRNMTALDATGLHALEQLSKRLRDSGRTLILCGARSQPASLLARADFTSHVGPENIVPHIQAALDRARQIQDEGRNARASA